MTISRISDTHTRYLQTLERMAAAKAERISSAREKDESNAPEQTEEKMAGTRTDSRERVRNDRTTGTPGNTDRGADARSRVTEENRELTQEMEERKADSYSSKIKEYERQEEEEKARQQKALRLENNNVVTPEDIRKGETLSGEEDEKRSSRLDSDEKEKVGLTAENERTDRIDVTDKTERADRADRTGTEEEDDSKGVNKDRSERESAEEKRENIREMAEQGISPQDAYRMLSGNRVDSEFVLEMNSRSRNLSEADVLRSERDIDRARGVDTTLKEEQIENLMGTFRLREENNRPEGTAEDKNLTLERQALQNFQVSIS